MKKYSSYKDSGIEWIGEIPESWEIRRLKTTGSLYSGLSGKSGNDFNNESNANNKRFINFTNVAQNKYIVSTNLGLVNFLQTETQNIVKKGDLLFLMSSENQEEVGKCSLLNEDLGELYLNSFCKGFRFSINDIEPRFVNFLLNSSALSKLLSLEGRGFTRINLRMEGINNIPVLLPPYHEQIFIANYLDRKTSEIETLISKKQCLIELLKEERTAIINHAVTKGINPDVKLKPSGIEWIGDIPEHWEVKRIRYLFDIIKNISGELGYDVLSITQNGIKVKDITSGAGQLSMDYSKYQIVEVGDYAMNHMDLLTGFIDKSKFKGVTSPDYRVFRSISEESESEYFLYLFQMCYKNKIFFPLGQGSAQAGRWRLPTDAFRDFILPIPPIIEQNKIVRYIERKVSEIATIISKTEKEIRLLNEYKTALISEVVTGKVDVREEVLANAL